MKIVHAFLTLPKKHQIALSVLISHLFFLFGALFQHGFSLRKKELRSILVKMYTPESPARTVQITPFSSLGQTPLASPSHTTEKKVPKVNVPEIRKKSRSGHKPAQPEAQAVLKEISQSLDVLKSKPHPSQIIEIPQKIASKSQPMSTSTDLGVEYREFLIAFLQNNLDLPEYGKVKAKLTINSFGTLVFCEILETESAKNALFLQHALQTLSFPRLDAFGLTDSTYFFTITFRNLEIQLKESTVSR